MTGSNSVERHNLEKQRRSMIAAVAFTLQCSIGLIASPVVHAQWGQQKSQNQKSTAAATKYDAMQTEANLPDLPTYTGKGKFLRGNVCQGTSSTAYIETYVLQEPPDQVVSWYKNTLSMYKWHMNYSTPTKLGAVKDKNSCCITVQPNYMKAKIPGRCVIQIDYNQGN